jgi:UDP-perosamine 4-acetyltransferase
MDVVIIGAGGHGGVVLDILRAANVHKPIGFLDADPALAGQRVGGLPVLGQANLLPKLKAQKVKGAIVAIGDPQARLRYAKLALDQGFELINAIHPRSIISSTATLGTNVVVAAGAVISTAVEISDSVIINTGAIVDHECTIGQASHISPAAALAGRVRIGPSTFVGLGSRIIQCIQIGSRATIGAGAVVIHDVPDDATSVGVPARIIKIAHDACAA